MGDQHLWFRGFQYFHTKPDTNQHEYAIGYSNGNTDPDPRRNIYTDVYIYAGSIANIHTHADSDEHIQCIGSDLCGWIRVGQSGWLDVQ